VNFATAHDRALVASVATGIAADLPSLSRLVTADLLERIPELRIEPALDELLHVSVESNISAVLDSMISGSDAPEIEAPGDALDYARTLAQRGVPVHALVRAYRIGHQSFTDAMLTGIRDRGAGLGAAEEASRQAFRYIDIVTHSVVEVYESERERWLASRNTIWLAELRAVLDDDPAAPEVATIGTYRVDQWHRAGILWAASRRREDLTALRATAEKVARTLSPGGSVLVVPQDQQTVWFWAASSSTRPASTLPGELGVPPHARVALGSLGYGPGGFRQTHREATSVKRIADFDPERAASLCSIETDGWRILARYVDDMPVAAAHVRSVLGKLALDSAHAARLRETLRLYLHHRRSNQAAAAALGIHPNSVKYRVAQALAELAVEVDDNRLDVEIALLFCAHFGRSVLTP
jgi:DNA-binding PucR family transcriptional regulator